MESLDYAVSEADREQLGVILSHAFGFPVADGPLWFSRAGDGNVRVWRRDGALAGGLITIPMGQFFGGRSVPMTGIAGVGIAPWARGEGSATRMMQSIVRELHAKGVALSTLYPATVPLYQRAGYERAGGRWVTTVRPHDLPSTRSKELRAVPLQDLSAPEVREVYARFASARDGWLDRGPYQWTRVERPARGEPRALAIVGPAGIEGYVVAIHKMTDGHDTELNVTDLVAVTPRAAREALAILAAYRSLAQEVRWSGAPHDTFTQALPERFHRVTLGDFWMLRLTHVAKALEARGYNPALKGSVTLTVSDEVIPENAGSYRVEVERGAVTVTRAAGAVGVRLDVRALASAFSGFRRVSALARDGLATGDDGAVRFADALFASEGPAMSDGF